MKIALFLIFLTLLTTFTITTATPAPFPELLDKRTVCGDIVCKSGCGNSNACCCTICSNQTCRTHCNCECNCPQP
ncbi:unnamed protein product [Rhizophagus irregularis]|uniref:Uncharacterized protein n=1 Tax=Rhizophagus irregularis TaxID=588596 RepID=A0A916EM73_9GLOM|nr:unnamed protein product [Rhizophagus irregularis]CAB5190251.1 unnamed protein product [Rhizophagus irregularis]CAB5394506.1 unnamed protein product [Rhizophagus irregularis]